MPDHIVFACLVCNKPLQKKPGGGRNPKYCSRRCQTIGVGQVKNVVISGDCLRCGKPFTTTQPYQIWCSVACRNAEKYRKGSSTEATCKVCGKIYRPKKSNRAMCCSRECGLKLTAAKLVERDSSQDGELKEFLCEHCGESFSQITVFSHIKYCSRTCAHRAQRGIISARKRVQRYEGIDPSRVPIAKLIERDKGVCYHCKQPVDAAATMPDPMSPTRDHFIPLSKGGGHTWDNIVLSHFRCNLSKSDRLPDQDGQLLMFAV